MPSNLPPGCTEADIDRAFGGDYFEEPSEAQLEAEYLDRLEIEAAELPSPTFYEYEAAPGGMSQQENAELQYYRRTRCPQHGTTLDPNGMVCADCVAERILGVELPSVGSIMRRVA